MRPLCLKSNQNRKQYLLNLSRLLLSYEYNFVGARPASIKHIVLLVNTVHLEERHSSGKATSAARFEALISEKVLDFALM